MDSQPFRGLVFCHYCDQWGLEDEFSVTSVVVGGVIRQLLYHKVEMLFDIPPVSHIANWRREDGLQRP